MYLHHSASFSFRILICQFLFPLPCPSDIEGQHIINMGRGRIVEAAIHLRACLNAVMPVQRIFPILAPGFQTRTDSSLKSYTQLQDISQRSEMVTSCVEAGLKRMKERKYQAWCSTCHCPVCSSDTGSLQYQREKSTGTESGF